MDPGKTADLVGGRFAGRSLALLGSGGVGSGLDATLNLVAQNSLFERGRSGSPYQNSPGRMEATASGPVIPGGPSSRTKFVTPGRVGGAALFHATIRACAS